MELKILSPQEGGFVKEICWNNEELKVEIAEKMQEYKKLVFTEETIKEAKTDRAKLNKLKGAFEDERKRIKRLCMEPYNEFEKQVKELISLIDEPIQLIDSQIKEVEQVRREEKRRTIEELFSSVGFQPFVTLELIWDEKWLNATVSINKIEEQMKSKMYQIGEEISMIHSLPEFSFEAMEEYKKSLDITKAIQEGARLSDIQKRKVAYEEEQRIKQEEEKKDVVEKAKTEELMPKHPESLKENTLPVEQLMQIDFRVWGTRQQLMDLRNYLINNQIKYGKVE